MESINQEQFKNAILQDVVLIDFSATWCVPCQLVQEQLKELEELFPQIDFFRVDVDEERALAKDLKIISVPVILLYKKGELIKEINGYTTSDNLKKIVEYFLAN